MKIFFLNIFLLFGLIVQGQKRILHETSIVARIIECDSVKNYNFNLKRFGYENFYGVHHFKVQRINSVDKSIIDTAIIAYVYNMATDKEIFLNNFNLKVKGTYIFHLVDFIPSESDFVKLNGFFKDDSETFAPKSNYMIKEYKKIYRIIFYNKLIP